MYQIWDRLFIMFEEEEKEEEDEKKKEREKINVTPSRDHAAIPLRPEKYENVRKKAVNAERCKDAVHTPGLRKTNYYVRIVDALKPQRAHWRSNCQRIGSWWREMRVRYIAISRRRICAFELWWYSSKRSNKYLRNLWQTVSRFWFACYAFIAVLCVSTTASLHRSQSSGPLWLIWSCSSILQSFPKYFSETELRFSSRLHTYQVGACNRWY